MRVSVAAYGTFLRRGAVTFWLLISLVAIIGILAIGMDGGRMMDKRRHVQAGADAAALAAAANLYQNGSASSIAKAAALSLAAANGFNNDGITSTVTVNIPPASGSFAGQANYVEVIVQYTLPKSFGGIFTSNDLPVKARAVALGRPLPLGIILLGQDGANAFLNNNLGTFTVVNGRMYVNSSDAAAFNQNTSGSISAQAYDVYGNYTNAGGGSIAGPVRTGVRRTADPFVALAVPDRGALTVRSTSPLTITSSNPTTLQPGVYQGGINISQSANVVLSEGIYYMDGGGLQISGQATVQGTEVLIYNTSGWTAAGPIAVNTTGKVSLSADTSGTYKGICIFQDRTLNQPISITGNGNTSISGTVYAPNGAVSLTGNANGAADTLGGAYVCLTMQVAGSGNININLGSNRPPVPNIALVE